ncbi:MAG TPA: hypothetical protein PKE58_13545 [Acidobacteriota bacterium]|nr:hypothetical protein [Acidobacteriota bacterium]
MKITHVSTSQRCETCHQPDQFDPVQEGCLRCAGAEVGPHSPLPLFLATSLIPPSARPKVKITLRGVIHFTLALVLALILNGGALLAACAFNEPAPNVQNTSSEEEWTFPRYQPKTIEEHLVESFDGFSRVLLPGLWFGVANTLLWVVIARYLPSVLKEIKLESSSRIAVPWVRK